MLLKKYAAENLESSSHYFGLIGALSLSIGILLSRFANGIISDFTSGLLLGLSLAANLFALVLFGKFKRSKGEKGSEITTLA